MQIALKSSSQFDTKSKQAALAQSQLEQPKRRQRRNSSLISTDLEARNTSDTVEVINLVSVSPQQIRITLVTSSSPKDFMTQNSPGRKSMDKIVPKLHYNQKNDKAPPPPIQENQPQPRYESIITIPTIINIPNSPPKTASIIE